MRVTNRNNEEMKRDDLLAAGLAGQSEERQAKHRQAERLLAEQLVEGNETASADAELEAVRRLPPRWEIRIQSEHDPVAEETKKYRAIAQEVDDRYDGKDKKNV